MEALRIVKALGGRWRGTHGFAKCPVHKDDTPSLHVVQAASGKVLLRCFAGCDRLLIIKTLGSMGLWEQRRNAITQDEKNAQRKRMAEMEAEAIADEQRRLQTAVGLWDYSMEIEGTIAERYLRGRAITDPLPSCLRYHPCLYHRETRRTYPALIARLDDNGGMRAVQRTYLSEVATKANVSSPKMTLGDMKGAAVRLSKLWSGVLGLAEGIETALSASQLYGIPTWAVLSVERLAKIDIPPSIDEIRIFADANEKGSPAHLRTMQAVRSLRRRGFVVDLFLPPSMKDFNDVLKSGGVDG